MSELSREQRAEIATTILNQLGGKHFQVMTGARDFAATGKGVQFKIGRNGSKANIVVIELEANDTYALKFCRFYKMEFSELESFDDVYCDQLKEIFTSYTGLATSL